MEVEVGKGGEGDDLEEGVQGNENSGGLSVATGEVVPDEHHRYATGESDDDEAGAIRGQVGKHQPGQGEHEGRPHEPVQDERRHHESTVGGDPAQLAVADLGEHGVHHHEQTYCDRQAGASEFRGPKPRVEVGKEPTECDSPRHRCGDPHRQESVEQGEPTEDRALWHRLV